VLLSSSESIYAPRKHGFCKYGEHRDIWITGIKPGLTEAGKAADPITSPSGTSTNFAAVILLGRANGIGAACSFSSAVDKFRLKRRH
jgi:hypothetical protein